MIRSFVIASFLILSIGGFSQSKIIGKAPAFSGKYASLLTYDDYISYETKNLGKAEIDSLGNFEIEVDPKEGFLGIVEIEENSGLIYIDPNTSEYKIYFSGQTDAQKVNNNSSQLIFDELDKNDLNTLILEFNLRLDHFILTKGGSDTTVRDSSVNMKTFMSQEFSDSLMQFKKRLIKEYKPIKNRYFHDYIRYSIAVLDQMAWGNDMVLKRLEVFNNYLKDMPIQYHNDAYMMFLDQFFENLLKSPVKGGRNAIYQAVNVEASVNKLIEIFAQDKFLENEQLRELVLIKSLGEAYHSREFIGENIIFMLKELEKESIYPENRKIASNTVRLITKLKTGYPASDFKLKTQKEGEINLSQFKGKHVYIGFFATWDVNSMQEIEIIKDLEKRYGKYVEFISISVDKNKSDYYEFLKNNSKLKWHIGHYDGDMQLLTDYNIKSLPVYFLVGPDGNILQAPAYKPSPNGNYETIDKTFFNIKKKLEPKNNRKIGGRN